MEKLDVYRVLSCWEDPELLKEIEC
jgi:hypothetical protein